MKKTAIIFSLLFVVILAACNSEDAGEEENTGADEGDTIYTTVYPLQFITEEIAGDSLQVDSILPAGADAHTYEPTTREMVSMAEGEAFIYTKDEFEAYAATIADTLKEEGVATLPVAEDLEVSSSEDDHSDETEEEEGHEGHDHSADGEDPHVWLDPMLLSAIAEKIEGELTEMYPEKGETFEENTTALKERLEELDSKMAETIEEADTKEVVVSHAAYGYWEKAYGLKQIPVSGLTSTDEPSQKELEQVIETAQEHNLSYVIFERNVSAKSAEVVQNEIGAEPLYLHNLATRSEEEIEEEKDYFDLMEENREVLEQALNK